MADTKRGPAPCSQHARPNAEQQREDKLNGEETAASNIGRQSHEKQGKNEQPGNANEFCRSDRALRQMENIVCGRDERTSEIRSQILANRNGHLKGCR